MKKMLEEPTKQQVEFLANISSWRWNPETNKVILSSATNNNEYNVSSLSLRSVLNHIDDDDREFFLSVIRQLIKTEHFPKLYVRLLSDQAVKHVFINGKIKFNIDSRSFSCYGIIQDVSEARELSELLKKQNKQLKDIAWMQSHEVRSEVATILGLIELLTSNNLSASEQNEILQGIKTTGLKLDSTIKKIDAQTFISER